MKKLSYDEILKRLEESSKKTGYEYLFTENPNKFLVYCPKHKFSKLQNKNYVFQGRRINCCNEYSPLTINDYNELISKFEGNYNVEMIGEFKGGDTIVKITCLDHNYSREIKLTSLKYKKTEFICNRCSHEKYNRKFEYSKEKWIEESKKIHGDKYDYSKMEDHGLHRTIICPKHGEFKQNIYNHVYLGNGCPKCVIIPSVSSYEEEIYNFLLGLGLKENIDFKRNDRSVITPEELDFYFPKLNIAIEFNGDYWHSDIKKCKTYHQNKSIKCRELDINLIMLYQYQFHNKKEIIFNRLKSLLGFGRRIFARKCIINSITFKEMKDFCNKYHIQGYSNSSYNYGLTYNNELVGVMTFGRSRFNENMIELIRYCSNGNIIGGASKLLYHFIRENNPTQILSYADFNWSNGNLYEKLGFIEVSITNPDYIWIKGKDIKSRYQCQMKNENKIMRELGYLKIYRSGNIKYIKKV